MQRTRRRSGDQLVFRRLNSRAVQGNGWLIETIPVAPRREIERRVTIEASTRVPSVRKAVSEKGPSYLMSFVTGGIYLNETLAVAAQHEQGASWLKTAARALESGAFPVRKESSAKRTIREITHRLRCLDTEELDLLASGDREDQVALLWLAICRAYRFIREFTAEVISDRFAGHRTDVSYEDFEAFFARKAEWSPQLGKISGTTRAKLRAVMFRFLRESGIITDEMQIRPALLSPRIWDHIQKCMARPVCKGFVLRLAADQSASTYPASRDSLRP
jgi:Putative inner membrane protein (DUF1819)